MDESTAKYVTMKLWQGANPATLVNELSEGDKAALMAWMMSAPPRVVSPNGKPPANWLEMSESLGPISWAWENWLPNGLLTMLVGEQGMGKSNLALRLAACFLQGDAWPDGTACTQQGGVLWCEAESSQALNLNRALRWGLPVEKLFTPLENPLDDVMLDNEQHRQSIFSVAMREDIVFIIVDSLRGANMADENSSKVIGMMKWLAELAKITNKPVLITHHLRKKGLLDIGGVVTLDRVRGSGALTQLARVVIALDMPDANNNAIARMHTIKNNIGDKAEPIGLTITSTGVTFTAAPSEPRVETMTDKAADRLIYYLNKGAMASMELKGKLEEEGITWSTANRAKSKLGIIDFRKDGHVWWGLRQE